MLNAIKSWFRQFPLTLKAAALLSGVVALQSAQVLLVVQWIVDRAPAKSPLTAEIVPEWLHLLRPEKEMFLFHVFVGAAVLFQGLAFATFKKKLNDDAFFARLKTFALVEGLLVFLWVDAAFKMIVYDYQAELARRAFVFVFILALINKIFWPFVSATITMIGQFLTDERNAPVLRRIADVTFGLLIVAVIYIPNTEALVARMFIGEQFHHNDSFVFGPAWAYLSGCALDADVISQYGLGMPVIIGLLAKHLLGFSYLSVVQVMMGMCIVYYVACFLFLRGWLKSPVLALAAILFAIKVQMFHTGVYPIVLTYGSATVIRYFFDIFFMYFIWMHIQKGQARWLAGAAVCCGLALFHITAEGIYLTATFYFYLGVCFLEGFRRKEPWGQKLDDLFTIIVLAATALITAFVLLFLTEGAHLFTAEFWHNTGEFIEYFLSGFGLTPIYESLQNRFFLASLMGFVIPLVYVLTLLIVGGLLFFEKIERRHWLVVVLCVYGLGLYHYYIARSAVTSYYAVAVPYVFILAFWVKEGLEYVSKDAARRIALGLLSVSAFCLATTHDYMAYPNVFNFSRNPMVDPLVVQRLPNSRMSYFNHLFIQYPDAYKFPLNSLGEANEDLRVHTDFASDDELVAYYRKEFNFAEDAKLIADLTPKGSKAAVLSSFEVKMLMQADRKPFFYYYPMVISRPLRMRMFVVNSVYTTDQLKKTIDQLETAKPEYIFMEKIFLNNYVPQAYFYDSPGFMPLLDYVQKNYVPSAQGKFLVAMKRR